MYKPSDKTSSDPVEFWYEPTVTTPHLLHGSPVAGETFKTPKKRPKERAAADEASTGNCILSACLIVDALGYSLETIYARFGMHKIIIIIIIII